MYNAKIFGKPTYTIMHANVIDETQQQPTTICNNSYLNKQEWIDVGIDSNELAYSLVINFKFEKKQILISSCYKDAIRACIGV